MRLVLGHDGDQGAANLNAIFGAWAAARIPHLFLESLGPFVTFGIVDDEDQIRGCAIYHGWTPRFRGIEISFVLDGQRGLATGLTASVIAGIFAYAFEQLDVLRVTAATPGRKSAASARRFLSKFGFKREGLMRKGFGEFGDAVVYGLTQRDWRESHFNRRARLGEQKGHASGAHAA